MHPLCISQEGVRCPGLLKYDSVLRGAAVDLQTLQVNSALLYPPVIPEITTEITGNPHDARLQILEASDLKQIGIPTGQSLRILRVLSRYQAKVKHL